MVVMQQYHNVLWNVSGALMVDHEAKQYAVFGSDGVTSSCFTKWRRKETQLFGTMLPTQLLSSRK